ncbi:MAG: hypothetical protein KBT27_02105 [Prevotellaceae bacterium]|nr:hypothetical protein [Candidatus Faecinaster equi]
MNIISLALAAKNSPAVINIGSYQYTYEDTVLPAIDVKQLRTIYQNDKRGRFQTLHWTLYGSESNFKIVSSDYIMGQYSIDILVHNKYHCAYAWTDETSGVVEPVEVIAK